MSESSIRETWAIRDIWGEAWVLLKKCLGGCLSYGLGFQVIATLLLTPFFVWAGDRALALSGAPVATNFDIASAVLSLAGIASFVVGAIGTAVLGLLGVGGYVIITGAAESGRSPRLRVVTQAVAAASPRLLRPSLWRVGLFVLAVLPILGLVLALLRDAALGADNFFLQVVPKSTGGAIAFYALLLVVAVYLYKVLVRWTFMLHAFLLERRRLGDAIKRSAELVASSRGAVLRTLLSFHLFALLLPLVGAGLLKLALHLGFRVLAPDPGGTTFVLVAAALLVVSTVGAFVALAFAVAVGTAITTVMFTRLGGKIVEAAADDDARSGVLSRRQTIVAFVALFVIGALFITPRIVEMFQQELVPVGVTAHRGSSAVAPENSMAAFRRAIEEGTDYIELDVLETKDRGIIVVHDPHLGRLTGVEKYVYELTVDEIQELDSGSHFDSRFSDERMPTLKQVMELVRGKAKLNIELKTHGEEKDFPDSVVRLIHDEDFNDECVVTSLDYAMLKRVRELDPELRLGMIVTASLGDVHALDVDFYSVEQAQATVAFIQRSHAKGREVHVWTVNKEKNMELFMDRDADNLITDYPAKAAAVRDARTAEDDVRSALVRIFQR